MIDLMGLDDAAFRKIVDADLRQQADPAVAAALRSTPEVIDRWYFLLQAILRSTEGQLESKAADLEAEEERVGRLLETTTSSEERRKLRDEISRRRQDQARWRARIIRFKSGVEEVLAEAERLRSRRHRPDTLIDERNRLIDERNRLIHQLLTLQDAIRAHRDHFCDERCGEECVADLALWALVD